LANADLKRAWLVGAKLYGVNFTNVNLEGVDLGIAGYKLVKE
jgi:uncharacterized protein YjbI with pentapeptide repeats